MKDLKKTVLVSLTVLMLTALSLTGCGSGGGSGGGDKAPDIKMPNTSGQLTITGLENYNGMYIGTDKFPDPNKADDWGWIAVESVVNAKVGDEYAITPYYVQIKDDKDVLKVWKLTGNYKEGYKFENFTENWTEGFSLLLHAIRIYSTQRPYGNTEVASGRLDVTTLKFVKGVCTTSFIAD